MIVYKYLLLLNKLIYLSLLPLPLEFFCICCHYFDTVFYLLSNTSNQASFLKRKTSINPEAKLQNYSTHKLYLTDSNIQPFAKGLKSLFSNIHFLRFVKVNLSSLSVVCYKTECFILYFSSEHLRVLYLGDNDFEDFPAEVKSLKNLQIVSMIIFLY